MTQATAFAKAQALVQGSQVTRDVEIWVDGYSFILEPSEQGFVEKIEQPLPKEGRPTKSLPIRAIKKLYSGGTSVTDIALKFKVSRPTIYKLLKDRVKV